MFGYLRMFKQHTPKQLHKVYKNYYCGMCFAMQHNYGLLSRYLISYDLMIIGLLMKSHEEPECDHLHCFGKKEKKHQFRGEKWKRVAAVNVLLTAGQLRDNIEDDNSLVAKLFFRIFAKQIKMARDSYPEVYSYITTGYDKMLSDEKAGKSVVEISSSFSTLMESVYKCVHFESDTRKDTLAYIKSVAGWLYFIDQLDDYDKDVKLGRLNPMVKNGVSGSDYIDFYFSELLGMMRHFYQGIRDASINLSLSSVEDRILQNLLLSTIPSMTEKVLNRSKPPELKHFRDGTVWSNV